MTLALPIFLVLVLVVLYCLWFYKTKWKILQFSKTINGPVFLPILGNVYILLGKGINDVLTAITYTIKRYGPTPVGFWIGHDFYYISTNVSELKTIYNHPKCLNKGAAYKDFQFVFNNSLLILPVQIWKPRRKINARCFKSGVLKSYQPIFYQSSLKLANDLAKAEKDFDLVHMLDKCIFMTFFATCFGITKEFPEAEAFGDICVEVQSYFGKRIVDPILPLKLWLKLSGEGRKVSELVAESRRILDMVLKFKRENLEEFADESTLSQLDMLIKEKDYNEDSIFQEMALFTAAATDTTGHTLAFVIVLLGMFPEVQQKVYEEVILAIQDRNVDVEDLPKLKYTEMVILEGMRMFPPIPLVARTAGDNIDLGNNKIIPEGSNILMPLWHLHRDTRYWKNPEVFDPERFNPENIVNIEPYSFLPFSGGPRDCIGKTFAMMEMKTTVATIVRALKITSNHKTTKELVDKCISCISLNIKSPLDCQFYQRKVK